MHAWMTEIIIWLCNSYVYIILRSATSHGSTEASAKAESLPSNGIIIGGTTDVFLKRRKIQASTENLCLTYY